MRDDSRDYIRSYLFIYSSRGETLEKADLISSDIHDISRIVEKDRVSGFSLEMDKEIPRIML